MQIVNPGQEDFHTHSSDYSDGLADIYRMVDFAGQIGLKRIAITDHSQAVHDKLGLAKSTPRYAVSNKWKRNPLNEVQVIFGIEGDILNERGDICDNIQGESTDFLILSAHELAYAGPKEDITQAYLNAIRRHGSRIKFIGHPHAHYFAQFLDASELVKAANDQGIALEVNCSYLGGPNDERVLQTILERADRVYVNSDAHTLDGLVDLRPQGFAYLKEKGLLE